MIDYTGFLAEPTGYGRAARLQCRALMNALPSVRARSIYLSDDGVRRAPTPRALRRPSAQRAASQIVHVPPQHYRIARAAGLRTIACVAWEMDVLPSEWTDTLAEADEIWTCSDFAARAFSAHYPAVAVIRHPVSIPRPRERSRLHGIDDDTFLFFSLQEWSDRKNPLGLLRAFGDAFAGRNDVALLLKIGGRFAHDHRRMIFELASEWGFRFSPRLIVVTDDLDRRTLNAIHDRANAFVSLHRAEGFGLGLAEAMARACPVVATGYSGNMDFMDAESAFLVDYRCVPVHQELTWYPPFDAPGLMWAEPDHDAAVEAMRACARDDARRARIGLTGRERVRALLDPTTIGQAMVQRLRGAGWLAG